MDKEKLITRQSELIKTIEAIDDILHSKSWQVLRSNFEERIASLEKQLLSEARNMPIDINKFYVIQGQISEAKRFDFPSWAEKLKKELIGIKNNLQ